MRDKEKNERLELKGWTVLRFWEHELSQIDMALNKISSELSSKRLKTNDVLQ